MNLPLFVARRYLFTRKKRNVINLINWVTLGGIAIGTAAILLVLSTFNGLSDHITGMYAIMDPDLKIVARTGRLIKDDSTQYAQIAQHPQVTIVTRTVEGKILLQYQEKQSFGILKGVEPAFSQINPVNEKVYEGQYTFDQDEEGYPSPGIDLPAQQNQGAFRVFLNLYSANISFPIGLLQCSNQGIR